MNIDSRILATSIYLTDWSLSSVYLKNEQNYPWFILIPRKDSVQEIYQLEKDEREVLMDEINFLSLLIKEHYQCDKINIGALGNVVPQLHVHVVGRSHKDPLWPQGIWQEGMVAESYSDAYLEEQVPKLKMLFAR
ncbi:MAG: HIT family protein [Legionella sp.]